MKKVTTTFVASFAVLALACPLYAADEKKMTTDPKQQAGSQYQEGQRAGTSPSAPARQVGASQSQSTQMDGAGQSQTAQQASANQSQSAEGIKGFKVFSQTGEKMGEITEVKTDNQSGKVQFVTLSKGGVMGMGAKDTAVPLEALKLDRENEKATLTVSDDKIKNGPTQAGKSDQDFQRELSSHYGISPVWEEKPKTGETQVPRPVPGLETGSPTKRDGSN